MSPRARARRPPRRPAPRRGPGGAGCRPAHGVALAAPRPGRRSGPPCCRGRAAGPHAGGALRGAVHRRRRSAWAARWWRRSPPAAAARSTARWSPASPRATASPSSSPRAIDRAAAEEGRRPRPRLPAGQGGERLPRARRQLGRRARPHPAHARHRRRAPARHHPRGDLRARHQPPPRLPLPPLAPPRPTTAAIEEALHAYNRGPGTVDRIRADGGDPANGYADRVLGRGYASPTAAPGSSPTPRFTASCDGRGRGAGDGDRREAPARVLVSARRSARGGSHPGIAVALRGNRAL